MAETEKVAQVLLTVDGMAFIPVITAIVVGARLTGSVHGRRARPRGTSSSSGSATSAAP